MDSLIRNAGPADAGRLAVIYNQSTGKFTLDTMRREGRHFTELMQSLDGRECLLVIEQAGEVAGYGVLKKYSWKEGYRFAGETSVFLDEKYRGQGLGYLLKKELVGQARHLGYKHLVARIMAHNKVSLHYNLKLGYQLVGVQKQIGFTDGQWVDVAILQLILDGGAGDLRTGTPDH